MPAPVLYRLSFAHAAHHLVDVEAVFSCEQEDAILVQMPAWSPGSYMIRDYARHIENIHAISDNGKPLGLEKVNKDSFRIDAKGTAHVTVRYAVYGRELTVRTNYICEEFALLQGTATLLGYPALYGEAHEIEVHLPDQWRDVSCGLNSEGTAPHRFLAASFDAAVDSPLLLGKQRIETFEVQNIPHVFATVGGDETFDHAEAAEEARRIVRQNMRLWKMAPYQRYVFMTVLHGGGGGLEHHQSSVLMGSPTARATAKQKEDFAGLVAHEHFHAWNIKQMRPIALGPFDYQHENYTPSLWVAEGLTAYYDDLQACRAGVVSPAAYLARLAKSIEQLHSTPGRLATSLRLSSFDAWIKLYKPDENSINTTVSYYLKGSLVGFLLDSEIRHRSKDKRSLDDVMREAYARYSKAVGFTEEQFRTCVADVVGNDPQLLLWLEQAIDAAGELDWSPALAHYGLDLCWQPQTEGRAKHRDTNQVLGAHLESATGNAIISHVLRDTPAYEVGLNVGDEVIAIGDARVRSEDFIERLTALAERDQKEVSLLVARRGTLLRLRSRIDRPKARQAKLTFLSMPSEAQQSAREAWLGPVTSS